MTPNRRFDIASMRHRVQWQTNDDQTFDEMDQQVQNWTTVGEYWANVEPTSGSESTNADQLKAITTFSITMRNVGPIKPSDRFLFQGDTTRVLYIDSIFRVGERNAYLAITATEQKNPQ